jgi:hypothetical protein
MFHSSLRTLLFGASSGRPYLVSVLRLVGNVSMDWIIRGCKTGVGVWKPFVTFELIMIRSGAIWRASCNGGRTGEEARSKVLCITTRLATDCRLDQGQSVEAIWLRRTQLERRLGRAHGTRKDGARERSASQAGQERRGGSATGYNMYTILYVWRGRGAWACADYRVLQHL